MKPKMGRQPIEADKHIRNGLMILARIIARQIEIEESTDTERADHKDFDDAVTVLVGSEEGARPE